MFFKINKKKAFTLTELLVVVVIIGILATVALPKFNKVLMTRRTTEAEEIMRAIRTEQERRCALDKPYVTNLSALSDIVPNTSTDSY
ncbi:MAG: prepilin-type N-terminal cleavage/methylation domain-containing protein, partial [Elusimicrobiaceae bacterium]|nr:prepilin-type N-terminal cleavage/methylation domain-containing protein [Elusimicrobiaceae bacterium]